jgi:hypothetical protein
MASSRYQTLCHVWLPVSDISKSLAYSLVNRQVDCGTAGHCSVLPSQCCFNKQLSNKHTFTALSYFPLYQRTLCQYTYRTYLHISCPVSYSSHHKAVPSLWLPYQYSLYSAIFLLVSPHHSHCAVITTQSDPHVSTLCRKTIAGRL